MRAERAALPGGVRMKASAASIFMTAGSMKFAMREPDQTGALEAL
jgi:hypothetical protein